MEDYLTDLGDSLKNLHPDDKKLVSYNVLKSNEELIIKKVWSDGERKEVRCSFPEILTYAEKIQLLTNEFDSRHSLQIFPKNICLRKLRASGSEYGIWSNKEIPKGVTFGPCQGIICYDSDCPQILKDGKQIDYMVDSENNYESNWLEYVNFASRREEQNLIVLQCDEEIYYQTIKTILPDTELLVWYEDDCTTEIGNNYGTVFDSDIPKKAYDVSNTQKQYQQTENFHLYDIYSNFVVNNNGSGKYRSLSVEDMNYICNICGRRRFQCIYSFEQHLSEHSTENPYRCNLCEKTFSRRYCLEQHLYIHIGKKPYICDVCGKRFIHKGSLKRHIHLHRPASERPYHCNICGKAYIQKGNLNLHHRRIHQTEKAYKCDTCGKKFRRMIGLKFHQHEHVNEKN